MKIECAPNSARRLPRPSRRFSRASTANSRVPAPGTGGWGYSSELGALVNVEQQSLLRTQFLVAHDQRLEQLLGEPLPATAQAWKDYRGPARLIVLTARGSATKGKQLVVAIIAAAFRTSTSQRPLRLLGHDPTTTRQSI
jgi:hypothetical protein